MNLVKCSIDNFGKFSNQNFSFNDGLNSIIQQNGWGKSTLASFIKAMLYGLEETRKHDAFIDRERYAPWQGGNYGGSLVFSLGGKQYKIVRSFSASKKKDDTFALYDMKTNELSSDFSENLGEELFGVNLNTFERSVFVTLDENKIPQGSTDISAKLNDLIEDADDIKNFDNAYNLLDKTASGLKAKKNGTSVITTCVTKIEQAKATLDDIKSKELAVEEIQKKITAAKEELDKYKNQLGSVQEQFACSEKFLRKQNYDNALLQQKNISSKKNEIEQFFNGKVVDDTAIGNISSYHDEYKKYVSFTNKDPITDSDRIEYSSMVNSFGGNIPTEEEIASCQRCADDYDKLKQQINEKKLSADEEAKYTSLKKVFDDKNISEEMLDSYFSDYDTVQKTNTEIAALENEKNTTTTLLNQQKLQKQKNPLRVFWLVAAGLCVVAGVILLILGITPGICGLALGFVFSVVGILHKAKAPDYSEIQNKIDSLDAQIQQKKTSCDTLEKKYTTFLKQMSHEQTDGSIIVLLSNIKNEFSHYLVLKNKDSSYQKWLCSLDVLPETYEKKIRSFELSYYNTDDISAISSVLESLRGKTKKINELSKRINEYDANNKNREAYELKLKDTLAAINVDKTIPYENQILEIRNNKRDYQMILHEAEELAKQINEIESAPDFDSIKNAVQPVKEQKELSADMKMIQNKIDECTMLISKNQKCVDDYMSDIDKRQEVEDEIEQYQSLKKIAESNYALVTKTMSFLKSAKEKLDSNYMDPMKSGFEKYTSMLDSSLTFGINRNLEVFVENNGAPHESKFLSEGYKDLVNFCSRMALVDALFKSEKPVIILDDPFVNLDGDKLVNAKKIITALSKERQVLYFICHESRQVSI